MTTPWIDPTGGPTGSLPAEDAERVRRAHESIGQEFADKQDQIDTLSSGLSDVIADLGDVEALIGVSLIQYQILGSDTATVTFASIPQTYRSLRLVWSAQKTGAGVADLRVRLNNDTGASAYARYGDYMVAGAPTSFEDQTADFIWLGFVTPSSETDTFAMGEMLFPFYRGAELKSAMGNSSAYNPASTSVLHGTFGGQWGSTAAITEIDISSVSGNLLTGSEFSLYGLV